VYTPKAEMRPVSLQGVRLGNPYRVVEPF